ncbi:tryptophan--tRNA ligase [Halosolutus gelatinilyticus]|uniref:tryptophan--tRNA ligase n=1 Tax=Halosolutus gelatinilyticus TaxID=2931975 RepID=UPI001FF52AB6|nr:tryptophan--tRNA ligase [Halosolutus gelatinilyticus]
MDDTNDARTRSERRPIDRADDSEQPTDDGDADDFVVTPYAVAGEIDYEKLLDRFGADPLTDDQIARFPDHPLLRRRTFYAGRDVDGYLDAAEAGEPHAIVTGRGPSGPMHLGHILPLYLAKRFQEATGATVYVPLSDDEKFLAKDRSFAEIGEYARDNLRDVLAVGFDPGKTRIVVDTADADVIYPIAVRLAAHLTPATVEAVYGEQDSVGLQFYPAVQATHLLLPQFVEGRQPTLVPIAVDQDPHVRVCRDVAAKEALPVEKPGALLGRFLPSLAGPGKMSSSDDAPSIELAADPATVAETIRTHAYTGGQATVAEHRERGGDPTVDVPFQYLRYFFEADDDELDRIAADYRAGDLLSGELKEIAIERIADFLAGHRRRRAELGPLEDAIEPYRLTGAERRSALDRAGVPAVVEP